MPGPSEREPQIDASDPVQAFLLDQWKAAVRDLDAERQVQPVAHSLARAIAAHKVGWLAAMIRERRKGKPNG